MPLIIVSDEVSRFFYPIVCMEWQRNVLSELGLHIGLPFLQANTKPPLVSLLAILVYVWYTINRIKVERG